MHHRTDSPQLRRIFVLLAAVAIMTCAVAPRASARVPDKSTPHARVSLPAPGRPPGRLTAKPDSPPEWIPGSARRRAISRTERRVWIVLGVAQHSAAFFDARTTRDAVTHYRELDPLLRPFARSAALYPAMQAGPVGLDWLAIRLARSRHRWLRRLWWVPQAAATAGFLWSGIHNLSLPTPSGVPGH